MWRTLLSSAGAMLAGCAGAGSAAVPAATSENLAAARSLLKENVSVDVHSHDGPTGVTSRQPPNDDLARGMRDGGIAVVCLADVPDGPVLGRNANNVLTATRQPG